MWGKGRLYLIYVNSRVNYMEYAIFFYILGGDFMLSVLRKVESKVICIIDSEEYFYESGKDAYESLGKKYSIESIGIKNDFLFLIESKNLTNGKKTM